MTDHDPTPRPEGLDALLDAVRNAIEDEERRRPDQGQADYDPEPEVER